MTDELGFYSFKYFKIMDYKEKKEIADAYLSDEYGLHWDGLPDVNSLHDCETIEDIYEACEERLRHLLE